MIVHWENLRAGRGGCSIPLWCRGRRNIKNSLFLSSIVDTYSCGFCEMWCLVRVEDNWWVESGLGRV